MHHLSKLQCILNTVLCANSLILIRFDAAMIYLFIKGKHRHILRAQLVRVSSTIRMGPRDQTQAVRPDSKEKLYPLSHLAGSI